MQKEWFATWFDSKYYHLLYKQHDEQDAQSMVRAMLEALNLAAGSRILDLACGKGRHARYLADLGYDVTGVDISHASIKYARQFEHDHLAFYQHDMRLPFRSNYFDAVVNFFTSFGYFDTDADHERTLRQVATQLKPGGQVLIDFFNAKKVCRELVPHFQKEVNGVRFDLQKRIEDGRVFKKIEFEDEGRVYQFEEIVRLFTLADFECMMAQTGLTIGNVYGGYDLSAFDEEKSDRLIVLAALS
jgi:SAM-dependent methyltransferase